MKEDNKILLTFDVEEFDLPLEYNQPIGVEEQLQTGYKGLLEISSLLMQPGLQSTLFTTAFFAENFSSDIKLLAANHEIASHTYYHTAFTEKDLKLSKLKLEEITGKPVYGLRMPRMKPVPSAAVTSAGYLYNSSINPSWLPGRYNYLHVSRKWFLEEALIQFPVSVTPHLRVPLFWLAFKNLPYAFFLKLALQTLRHDGYLCLYFHPWEFINLSTYKLPFYIKKDSHKALLLKLKRLVNDLSSEGEFTSMQQFIHNHHQTQ